jgi:hypothetical protein
MGFTDQQQSPPGTQAAMSTVPDCGEDSYVGSGRLAGKRAVITGGERNRSSGGHRVRPGRR